MDRRRALLAGCALTLAPGAFAPVFARVAPPELAADLPGARLLGSSRLNWFGLHVYDARLWVPAEVDAAALRTDPARQPLALEIEYARALKGERIARQSLDEMRRAGALGEREAQAWLDFMLQTFPDVKAGDRITGVQRTPDLSRFHVNGRAVGELRDAGFMQRFFGIWLGPQTSQPALRERLLGAAT